MRYAHAVKSPGRPLVALLTDFGTRDHYVGSMKGALLAACPEATLVDITHEVSSFDVTEGAVLLEAAHRAFPKGTVFVAVVDPGVGSGRRALAAEAGGYRFVGPDNGLLTLALAAYPQPRIRSLTRTALFRPDVSPVFHGRDVFAPVAGRLAGGLALDEVGPALTDPVRLPFPEVRRRDAGSWEARVVYVDRFGNLVTNLTRGDLQAAGALTPGEVNEVVAELGDAVLPLAVTYADVAEGEGCALLGSNGRLEIAVHCGSAQERLGARRGSPVVVRRGGGGRQE